jgi:hypothetical protein
MYNVQKNVGSMLTLELYEINFSFSLLEWKIFERLLVLLSANKLINDDI